MLVTLTPSGNWKKMIFGGLQSPEVRNIKCKNCHIYILAFHFVIKKYRRMIKILYFISDL
jgi:hypothetical protein